MNTNTEYAASDKVKINLDHSNLLIALTVIIIFFSFIQVVEEGLYILKAAKISPEHFYTENISEAQVNITAPLENGKNISRISPNDSVMKSYEPNNNTLKRLFISRSAVAILFFFIPIIGISANILFIIKDMKGQYPPFSKKNSKKIAKIGGNIIFLGFANTLALFVIIIFSYNRMWLGFRFQGNDIILVAVGFLLIILSRIFNYGSYLQKEYDETI